MTLIAPDKAKHTVLSSVMHRMITSEELLMSCNTPYINTITYISLAQIVILQ